MWPCLKSPTGRHRRDRSRNKGLYLLLVIHSVNEQTTVVQSFTALLHSDFFLLEQNRGSTSSPKRKAFSIFQRLHHGTSLKTGVEWMLLLHCIHLYIFRVWSVLQTAVLLMFPALFSQHSAWWTPRSFLGRVRWRRWRRLRTSRHRSSWLCRWWLPPWRTARPPCPCCSRRWPQLERGTKENSLSENNPFAQKWRTKE